MKYDAENVSHSAQNEPNVENEIQKLATSEECDCTPNYICRPCKKLLREASAHKNGGNMADIIPEQDNKPAEVADGFEANEAAKNHYEKELASAERCCVDCAAKYRAAEHHLKLSFKVGFEQGRARSAEEKDKLTIKVLRTDLSVAECRIDELRAQLAHRHIIGKAYEITAENINRLAGECDELKAEVAQLKKQNTELCAIETTLCKDLRELRAEVNRLTYELDKSRESHVARYADLERQLDQSIQSTSDKIARIWAIEKERDELKAEVERLKNIRFPMSTCVHCSSSNIKQEDVDRWNDERDSLQAKLEKAKAALEFYANGEPCCIAEDGCGSSTCEFPSCVQPQFPIWDRGATARTTLTELEQSETEGSGENGN